METQYERVRGQDVELVASKLATGATPLTKWTNFSADAQIGEDEATACPAGFEQFTPAPCKATGSVSGFAGGVETMAELPQPGDELQTLAVQTVTEGVDLLNDLGDETKYGKIVVTKVHYDQSSKPGTWSFDWRSGGILPPVIEEGG